MKPLKQKELDGLLNSLQDEEEYVFLDTARSDRENDRSFLFLGARERLDFLAGDDPLEFFSRMEERLGEGFYLAGWISYELGYLLESRLAALLPEEIHAGSRLASFGVFSAPLVFNHGSGRSSFPVHGACDPLPDCSISNLRLSQEKEAYLEAISRIKDYIAAGDTYQVNYTLKLLFDFEGSPQSFYRSLRRNQSVPYGAMINLGGEQILSLSPELFFRIEEDLLVVRPMKGTMQRGRTMEEDTQACRDLSRDLKNRSENVMIVDLLRNDLGRLTHQFGDNRVVTRSLFDVERYESVLQMTSTIFAESGESVLSKVSIMDFFKALFPCGSVTGAPKIRTMEIIRELERTSRGVYTGGIGYLSPAGTGCFNVPIRTLRLKNGKGEMGIGSGIVHDSDPAQEWEECLLKGYFLTRPAPEFSLIETILWEPGEGYWLLEEHLERLAESATYFSFNFQEQEVIDLLRQLEEKFQHSCMRVRLTLGKDGNLETGFQPCDAPSLKELPDVVSAEKDELPAISLSPKRVDSTSPWFYHKTTHRELFQQEFAEAQQQGLFDVCFVNELGELTEGAISNLILLLDGQYCTPPVSSGLLGGTLRRRLLADNPTRLFEKSLLPVDLARAEALFCCNGVRGLTQVRLLGGDEGQTTG
ncbi:MAG: aminodeoxychorismate synthase component I [Thermodesulfobacteriota bacterium]